MIAALFHAIVKMVIFVGWVCVLIFVIMLAASSH